MRQVIFDAGLPRAFKCSAARRTGVHRTGDVQQFRAGRAIQFPPQFIGTAQQGHVRGMFVVGQSNDSRDAVIGPFFVRNIELLETQRFPASPRLMKQRGASHRAQTKHDGVIMLVHPAELRIQPFPSEIPYTVIYYAILKTIMDLIIRGGQHY